jgi:signal-transduction protein with cAMP-binding, CBS, and nucleotidyltransferase domain
MNSLEGLALLRLHEAMRSWDRPSVDDWTQVLADVPLFSGVSKRRLRKLVCGATFAEIAAGQIVLSNGANSDSLYIILGGAAKELRMPVGRELGVGDYFGESALIEGGARSAMVVATRALHVIRLPARSVVRLAQQHPAITLAILRTLSAQLRPVEKQVVPAAGAGGGRMAGYTAHADTKSGVSRTPYRAFGTYGPG